MIRKRRDRSATPLRWTAYAIILASVFWSATYLLFSSHDSYLWTLEGRLVLFGGLSSVAVAMAGSFWMVNRLQLLFRKRKLEDYGLVRWWARFLGTHHIIFGWTAFATAAAHTLYFASVSLDLSAHAITGWLALGALAALVSAGVLLNRTSLKRGDPKGTKGVGEAENAATHRRRYGLLHRTLAALFVVTLSLHTGLPLLVLGLWMILAIPTALVWRSKRSRHNIKKPEPLREPSLGEPASGERAKSVVPGQKVHR